MAVEARYFLGGQGFSARFADFVPRKMKYVAITAACPSVDRQPEPEDPEAANCTKTGAGTEECSAFCFLGRERRCSIMTN